MASFTWKPPEQLADSERLEASQDLETRYAWKDDLDPESVRAWDWFVRDLSEPVGALETFLKTVRPLQRPSTQQRVFISHRMGTAGWAERIAWLASQSAGLDYWLDVHDPVLLRATATLPPTDPRYAAAIAAIIEMALLNCTHVIALHTPPPAPPPGQAAAPWIPSQWIPYEIGRAKKPGGLRRPDGKLVPQGRQAPRIAERVRAAGRSALLGFRRRDVADRPRNGCEEQP